MGTTKKKAKKEHPAVRAARGFIKDIKLAQSCGSSGIIYPTLTLTAVNDSTIEMLTRIIKAK